MKRIDSQTYQQARQLVREALSSKPDEEVSPEAALLRRRLEEKAKPHKGGAS
jgi:hypothetical protein